VDIVQEDDGDLYLDFHDSRYSLKDNIKNYFEFLKHWKAYQNGDKIAEHGILVRGIQLEALYNLLKDSYEEVPFVPAQVKIPIKYINKRPTKDYTQVFYISDDITLSEEIIHDKDGNEPTNNDEFELCYKLGSAYSFHDIWKWKFFHNGNYEASIEAVDVPQFVAALKACIPEHA
jgi:hypothetical protein